MKRRRHPFVHASVGRAVAIVVSLAAAIAALPGPTARAAQAGAAGRPGRPCREERRELTSVVPGPGGGAASYRATSTRRCLFDGDVEMDAFRSFDSGGRVVFRGISFNVWNAPRDAQRTLWAMLGDPGHTRIRARVEGDALVAEGEGADASGAFVERSRTEFGADGRSRFVMDRSYDGGATWIAPFNTIDAAPEAVSPEPLPTRLAPEARVPATVPAGRGAWHVAFRRVDADGVVSLGHAVERRHVVLDGRALVLERTETDRESGARRRVLGFAARYGNPARWRTLWWDLDADAIRVVHEDVAAGATVEGLLAWTEEASERHVVRELRSAATGEAVERSIAHRIDAPVAMQIAEGEGACAGYRFVLGSWQLDARSMKADRTVQSGVGFMVGYPILDGAMIAADMHVIFEDGSGFRGSTLRSPDAATDRWHIYFVTPGSPPPTGGTADASREDLCEEEFPGEDAHGAYDQRLRLFDVRPDGFEVQMDRQYVGGPLLEAVWWYRARRLDSLRVF